MNGSTFYGGTALKIVYTLINYVAVVTSEAKSILRTIRGTTENLFGGTNWQTDFYGEEDAINLTITAGGSDYSNI